MASKPRKVKPAKVRLKQGRNESKDSYKKRIADAERAAFRAAADENARIDREWKKAQARKQTHGQRGGNDDDMDGFYTTEHRKGLFGRSTGWHD